MDAVKCFSADAYLKLLPRHAPLRLNVGVRQRPKLNDSPSADGAAADGAGRGKCVREADHACRHAANEACQWKWRSKGRSAPAPGRSERPASRPLRTTLRQYFGERVFW